jgi:hypothetical protein
MRSTPRSFRWFSLAAAAAASVLAGCTGSGQVQMVPWMRSDIRPGEPLIGLIQAREAWYWPDEKGGLNIVLARRQRSLMDPMLDFNWVISIVLEDLPAGREKLYRAGPQTFRMTQSYGVDRRRGRSLAGVVVIERAGKNRIRGRFHVLMGQQQFTLLSGWSPPLNRAPLSVVVGQFEAVLDAAKGQPLLKETEADGLDRTVQQPPITRLPSTRRSQSAPASAPAR